MNNRQIVLKKVNVNNLKNVDLAINQNQIIIFTGVSGSGKSSLAFDTIYVEGQRRYIETLPHASKRFLTELKKPSFQEITGLSPTIAIEQKTISKNPRSLVSTITSIYDFLRVLFAKAADFYCPISLEKVEKSSPDKIFEEVKKIKDNTFIYILAPFAKNKKGAFTKEFQELLKKGFARVRVDGDILHLEDITSLDKKSSHNIDIVVDRLTTSKENQSRLKESIYQAIEIGNGFFSILEKNTKKEKNFSKYAYSIKSKTFYPELTPRDFSFNHPIGMCRTCLGLGEIFEFDLDKIIDDKKPISDDCCVIASSYQTVRYSNIYNNIANLYNFDIDTPWKELPEGGKKVFLYGTSRKWTKMNFYHPYKKTTWTEYVNWKGVIHEAKKRLEKAKSDSYKKNIHLLMTQKTCPSCNGNRLKQYPLHARFSNKTIYEITALTINQSILFFENITYKKNKKIIAKPLVDEIIKRLHFLKNVGLEYLSLDRKAPTLSGGEAQRVKLASQIGTGLIGTTYILDEPSIGLHPHDHSKLINTLTNLKEKQNTIIIVEHDEDTIKRGDYIVDIGPLAGKKGGEIIAQGSLKDIMKNKNSITGKYLSGELEITTPKKRRSPSSFLEIKNASLNNLKNVNLKLPLHLFTCITGVSGSGKSSLISNTLYPAIFNKLHNKKHICGPFSSLKGSENIDKIIFTDQSPIGKTKRSNPATYIKVLDPIRDLFASLKESRIRGFTKSHFSFNVKEGSCSYCKGLGQVKMDMDFMENVYSTCQQCNGKRFDIEVLDIKYKGYNIHDILEMEVKKAIDVFSSIPSIYKKLLLLKKVGLDYLHLAQSSTSLSGGEAQRIKLAKELSKKQTGKTIYILDEPTRGLHFHDIEKLIKVLQELTSYGNTLVVIEHNPNFIKTADYIIDIGPSSGENGGKIIESTTFDKFIKTKTLTAISLQQHLSKKQIPKKTKVSKKLSKFIDIEGAQEHNLKNIKTKIPLNKISVFTGVSGSGKTSLAFDTIHTEAKRRYLDALPPYTRQFLKINKKPSIKKIENLPPSISVEQKNKNPNPRSTVGTITEVYDHLRILYAHMGEAYCPETFDKIEKIDKNFVYKKALELFENEKAFVLAPIKLYKKESFDDFSKRLLKEGFLRIRVNKKYFELDEKIPFNKNLKNELLLVVDRLIINKKNKARILESIELASKISKNELIIDSKKKDHYFNLSFASLKTGKSYPNLTPQTFSFNSEQGMCLRCQGIGKIYGIDLIDETSLLNYSILEILKALFEKKASLKFFKKYFKSKKIDIDLPIEDLSIEDKKIFFSGDTSPYKEKGISFIFKGINNVLATFAKHSLFHIRFYLVPKMKTKTCPSCKGHRLNPFAQNVKIANKTLSTLCSDDINKALEFVETLSPPSFLKETIIQIKNHLQFLIDIGLPYLSLNRSAPTLSGGEMMRLYLAKYLGTGLTNCLYVLDEPSIGLHRFNLDLLIKAIKKLHKLNNTIIIVEHDKAIIKEADFIFDFGPKAGEAGGNIVASGTYNQILKNKNSLTGDYLSNRKKIAIPKTKRVPSQFIKIEKASLHNLKNQNIKIPKNILVTISGVSGSGKSTIMSILKSSIKEAIKSKKDKIDLGYAKVSNLENIDKLVVLDQGLLSKNKRSDVSTYSEIMPLIRHFFSSLPLSKSKGFKPRYFSYNHKRGMCKTCYGLGYKKVDLQFLPSVKIECETCLGYKLNKRSLEITYKQKHIGHILEMNIEEASKFFEAFPKIVKKLNMLISTGLGYLKLGQDISSLSGGEGQRLKLSRELSKRSSSSTIYLLDEPTIGLHPEDVKKLLAIFQSMANRKNSLIIVEHNLDVIASSDFVIDIGPLCGKDGGEVIATGKPEDILSNKLSYTSRYLKEVFHSQ